MIGAFGLALAAAGQRRAAASPPAGFSFELLDEAGLSTFTSVPALRVSINSGPWQTIAAAGLTLARTAGDEITVSGFASPADALSARWHYEQEQPGEPYSAQNSVSALYARRVGGPAPVNPGLPGVAVCATPAGQPVLTT